MKIAIKLGECVHESNKITLTTHNRHTDYSKMAFEWNTNSWSSYSKALNLSYTS